MSTVNKFVKAWYSHRSANAHELKDVQATEVGRAERDVAQRGESIQGSSSLVADAWPLHDAGH
ncbi:hypothetical protein E2C01_085181 [Portunus trituberculatus]|uniref:Uncharacterized protein n=1 Tax=Portunus trituberculatus TaxID=210409 RepID=A0A5B7J9R9_PORTR|nr:hypothetical protein [Portunus trituberculatus]